MKIWFALLAATAICRAENLEQTYAPYGRLLITPFASAPFPHPSRAAGHQYKDKFFPAETHYRDNSVALFIPKGFRETPRVDVVVYFHGWGSSIESTLRRFQLVEQFTASGKNAVLVFPEGPKHASDSAGGKLEDPEGFKRFVTELTATLRRQAGGQPSTQEIGRVILAGHSGAYKVMAAILDRGGLPERVREVWLFDALYAETDKFLAWWDREPGRLLNIYTENGGTKRNSEAWMERLKQRGTPFLSTSDTAVTAAELKSGRLIFLSTDLGHNDVVEKRKTFGEFLKTSCLDDR
ncbi:MAG: hypothetical protein KA236_08240 [Verrucomicrobia bacterium]|nr:hypothetical protein [Verrucomicrobiota bacterium]